MPIGDHFEELRKRILRILIWVVIFTILGAFFLDFIWKFIMEPAALLKVRPVRPGMPSVNLIGTQIGDFWNVQFKMLIVTGILAALPAILFEIWGFILPALDKSIRKWGYALLISAFALFWTGVLFARFYTWPRVIEFLVYEWLPPVIPTEMGNVMPDLYLTISDYFSFFFSFHAAFGLCFELPVISIVLGAGGILRSSFFLLYWRQAMVGIAIIAAIITPPDVFSMFAMMLPMVLLYLVSAILVYLVETKKRVQEPVPDSAVQDNRNYRKKS